MPSHRVRLFVLPPGYAPTTLPPEERPGFTVDGIDDEDRLRAHIRERLTSWGYLVRAVNAIVPVRPGDAEYVATVVAREGGIA